MSEPRLAAVDLDAAADAYERDGCIRVRGFFDAADVAAIRAALDAATEANGPIYYIRGSHGEMLPHRPSGVKGNSMGLAVGFDKHDPFVGTLEPGDALVHHCQTIHYSSPNKTDQPRCGLLMVFRGSHTQPDPQLKAAYEAGRGTG
jgi:phytanoyl-CoA hydroxylase